MQKAGQNRLIMLPTVILETAELLQCMDSTPDIVRHIVQWAKMNDPAMTALQVAIRQREELRMNKRLFSKFLLNGLDVFSVIEVNPSAALQNTFVGNIIAIE